jgi:hypothetical protein
MKEKDGEVPLGCAYSPSRMPASTSERHTLVGRRCPTTSCNMGTGPFSGSKYSQHTALPEGPHRKKGDLLLLGLVFLSSAQGQG